jgi:hypothetical protein
MAKQSKRQQRLQAQKQSVLMVGPNGTEVIDDYEQFVNDRDELMWKQYNNWFKNFKSYFQLSTMYEVVHQHTFKMEKEEFTIQFFNDPAIIEQVNNSYKSTKEILGVLQIMCESKYESCIVMVEKSDTCDKDFSGRKYDLTDFSKVVTSLNINHHREGYINTLPWVFVQNLKVDYMENIEQQEAANVYSVLD